MPHNEIDSVKNAIDGTLGVGAVTSPFWINALETGLGLFMLVGGVLLLILRIMIAWREWRAGHNKPPEN